MTTAQKENAAALAKDLETRKNRLKELRTRESRLRTDLEGAREALGVATARGEDDRNAKDRVRGLAEDLEGTVRAISILNSEVESLEERAATAKHKETDEALERAREAAIEAVAAVEEAIREFEAETLDPLLSELQKRYQAAASAQDAARAAAPASMKLQYKGEVGVWGGRSDLRALLAALALHADGTLGQSDTRNDHGQGVIFDPSEKAAVRNHRRISPSTLAAHPPAGEKENPLAFR